MASDSSRRTVPLSNNADSDKKESVREDHFSLRKKCKSRSRSRYYICLGALVHAVNAQIEKKHVGNDSFYFLASRYARDLRKWIHRYECKELLGNYVKSLVASMALFALGIKLAKESAAWKLM